MAGTEARRGETTLPTPGAAHVQWGGGATKNRDASGSSDRKARLEPSGRVGGSRRPSPGMGTGTWGPACHRKGGRVLPSDRTSRDTPPSAILSHWMVTSPTTTHGAARGSGEPSVPGAWRSSGRGRRARELGEGGGPVPPGQGDKCQAGQGRVGTWQQDVSEQRGQGSGMAEVGGVGGSTGGGGGARRQRGTPTPPPRGKVRGANNAGRQSQARRRGPSSSCWPDLRRTPRAWGDP